MSILSSEVMQALQSTMTKLAVPGKGLLAADESTGTITKRFNDLNIECTQESRRNYRELLFTTPMLAKSISGVILYEETLYQTAASGVLFPELLAKQDIIPGIKVDKGLISLPGTLAEKATQGLDGLPERLQNYKKQGARFAKWRAVYSISNDTPSDLAIQTNAADLARYAIICQEQGIIPIVEPEVLIDGSHSLEKCYDVSMEVLHAVFHQLYQHKVLLEFVILKPSMITPGKACSKQMSHQEIAKATMAVLQNTVPAAVPSINFLSGGQTPEEATQNLNAMHEIKNQPPWNLSFSFARALQEPCMKAWSGNPANKALAQALFAKRAELNSLASLGKYGRHLEGEN